MKETYKRHLLEALPWLTEDKRFVIAVKICKKVDGKRKCIVYKDDKKTAYLLQIKAEKKCIHLGKRLIDVGRI